MNTPGTADIFRCGRLDDHDRHVWKGKVRELWLPEEVERDEAYYFVPSRTIGPWFECKGHVDVEGGHW